MTLLQAATAADAAADAAAAAAAAATAAVATAAAAADSDVVHCDEVVNFSVWMLPSTAEDN